MQKQSFAQVKLFSLEKAEGSSEFQSIGESIFFERFVLPEILAGQILSCELHLSFEIIPKIYWHNKSLQSRVYSPDYVLKKGDGSCVIVEVKDAKVRQLQRDYPLRKQLFLINYCIPNGWDFVEVQTDHLKL